MVGTVPSREVIAGRPFAPGIDNLVVASQINSVWYLNTINLCLPNPGLFGYTKAKKHMEKENSNFKLSARTPQRLNAVNAGHDKNLPENVTSELKWIFLCPDPDPRLIGLVVFSIIIPSSGPRLEMIGPPALRYSGGKV
jgi:hypothetical protein